MDARTLSILALLALVPVAVYSLVKADSFAWLAALNVTLIVGILYLMFTGEDTAQPASES